ncbi:nucleotide cyclase [Dunaliella salina]|nr:nucleotide cyclase [Dunaliella salina]|eukprot:KAF5834861.1 nucleotide cyclase [Dunaliella salina]
MTRPSMVVRLDTNFLSCCGTQPLPTERLISADNTLHIDEVYGGVDYSAPLLPPFLELSDFLQPVNVNERQSFKAAGMRCPALKLAGHDERSTSPLHWSLDPSYYMFAKCECEEGLKLVNLTKPGRIPYFECQVPEFKRSSSDSAGDHSKWIENYPWVVVIVVFVGCGLLVALSFILYLYKGKSLMRKIRNLKKRAHGLPKSGPFTVVVTDIQGWTALCAKHPELSVKVLNIHNSIIRQAQWLNFGCTHETEGDSFTIVFYDAIDATAFCLQAQQLLSIQQWPSPQHCLSATARTPSASADTILPVKVHNNPLGNEGPASADSVLPTRVYNNPLRRMSTMNVDGTQGNPSRRQSVRRDASFQGTFNRLSMIRDASTQAVGHMAKLASEAGSRYWTKLNHDAERGKPANTNIRVRMGMASGILQPGKRLHGHPTIEKAKEVSDAAAGGQILMDGSTFAEIKDFLQELGSVDAQVMMRGLCRGQSVRRITTLTSKAAAHL